MLTRLIALSALICQFIFPWWIIGLLAFAGAAWGGRSAGHAFRSGFMAIAILWTIIALFKTLPNDNILANRVGSMFMLPDWPLNWLVILVLTALLGGLAAGLAAMAGYQCKTAAENLKGDK